MTKIRATGIPKSSLTHPMHKTSIPKTFTYPHSYGPTYPTPPISVPSPSPSPYMPPSSGLAAAAANPPAPKKEVEILERIAVALEAIVERFC